MQVSFQNKSFISALPPGSPQCSFVLLCILTLTLSPTLYFITVSFH
nr:MAG TPA: hypothetical protein [Caudoviricetes sp.]